MKQFALPSTSIVLPKHGSSTFFNMKVAGLSHGLPPILSFIDQQQQQNSLHCMVLHPASWLVVSTTKTWQKCHFFQHSSSPPRFASSTNRCSVVLDAPTSQAFLCCCFCGSSSDQVAFKVSCVFCSAMINVFSCAVICLSTMPHERVPFKE